MLALRLRGSRGIRAQYSGPSCHAHFAHAIITGRGRPTALARSYATESTKANDDVSSEGAESAKKIRKHKLRGVNIKGSSKEKRSDVKSSKSTTSRKKRKGADATTADGANSGAKSTKSEAEGEPPLDGESKAKTIKILREATSLLREFQADPAKFAAKKPGKAQNGDSNRSLKKQFKPIKGTPKYDERQTKIFYETLTVVGDALKMVAQGTAAGKDKQADEHIAAAREAMAAITMNHYKAKDSEKPEKKAAGTTRKQSPKKKAEPKPEPESDKKTLEQSRKKEETQQKPESQTATKKKNDALPQKVEKEETDEAPPTTTNKTTAKRGRRPLTGDAVSEKLAAVVASARSESRVRRIANRSNIEDEAKPRSEVSKKKKKHGVKVETFQAEPASALTPIEVDTNPVPLIQYGLDRVLFKDGVYPLQDPRTRVWNFDPYLSTIMPVTDFDFEALADYITSSKDKKLIGITKDRKKKYTGSTSSMTSTLAHFHFLLSKWRPINCARLSQQFDLDLEGFSAVTKSPAATILNYKDGVYAIDADKEWDEQTVLSMLGKSMEKLLTVPKDEFVKYHRSKSHELTEEEKSQEEAYHYTTYGDFMMRSQLDAYDPRLPGTGVYDLKTRAVVSIRMDAQNVEKGVGYEIRQRDGNWESFEREYFDMIRSAFLKYSLQVRMGRMDGIFVAFHNTKRIFGFQYIPLEEMDLSLHGTTNKTLGDKEFTASLKLFNELLDQATTKFPKRSLRVFVETRPSDTVPFLYFFAEPVTDEQIKNIQERGKGAVEKFRAKIGLPLEKSDEEPNPNIEEVPDLEDAIDAEEKPIQKGKDVVFEEEDSDQVWQDMMDVVEDTMDKDAEGITAIREAIQEALEQSGLLQTKSSDEAQHYVEALLNAIIDADPAFAKSESQNEEDAEVVQESTTAESAEPSPEPKKSSIGSFFSWFRPSGPDNEVPAKQSTQQEASPKDGTETKNHTEEAENVPSPELVELLVKLTSRVGTTSSSKTANRKAKEQELSDDQARLRTFETILLDMMPDVLESAEVKADEDDAPSVETGDSPAAAKPGESEAENDSLFAMYVTVRNKVNDEPVERPENLRKADKWDVEYAMEELHGERARKLYVACKKRRTVTQAPRAKNLRTMFNGELVNYIRAGKTFRQREQEIVQNRPVWIVGQPAPLPAEEVYKGAGAKLVHVLPSLEHGRPLERKKQWKSGRTPVDQESNAHSKKGVVDDKKSTGQGSIAEALAELRKSEENKASSFKEWRERSKQSEQS